MASIGTGATVGITIWVVSDGRYEPQNFPFFHIEDSSLVWDWSTSSSNYTTLRTQNETALGGKGWEIESSLTLNQQVITSVILSGGQYSNNGGIGAGGVAQVPPSDATQDYLPIGDPDAGADADADAGSYESADDVRTADIAALFVGLQGSNVRVTRIRSDIAHTAMTQDFLLQASSDQSELSNIRNVTKSVNLTCPAYPGCSSVGCAAAPTSQPHRGLAALGVAGMLGLFVGRIIRARRRASRPSNR
jgi:MYXO-CTERM domain-containing protein